MNCFVLFMVRFWSEVFFSNPSFGFLCFLNIVILGAMIHHFCMMGGCYCKKTVFWSDQNTCTHLTILDCLLPGKFVSNMYTGHKYYPNSCNILLLPYLFFDVASILSLAHSLVFNFISLFYQLMDTLNITLL